MTYCKKRVGIDGLIYPLLFSPCLLALNICLEKNYLYLSLGINGTPEILLYSYRR